MSFTKKMWWRPKFLLWIVNTNLFEELFASNKNIGILPYYVKMNEYFSQFKALYKIQNFVIQCFWCYHDASLLIVRKQRSLNGSVFIKSDPNLPNTRVNTIALSQNETEIAF